MSAALSPADGCVTARQFVQCTACTHPQRAALDAAVIRGDSDRTIAALFGLSHDAVCRHRERHLRKEMRHALAVRGRSWTQRVDKLGRVLERQIDMAADPEIVQKTASTLNGTLRMLGEAAGEFPKQDVNVLILAAVGAPPPEAKRAVEFTREVEAYAEDEPALMAKLAGELSAYMARTGVSFESLCAKASGAEVL